MIKKCNDHYKFDLETAPGGLAPSDNANFYREDIPVLFFFTHIHEDYHRPGDDIEKVNVEGSKRILHMVYDVVTEVANAKDRPAFTEENSQALPKDFRQKMMQQRELALQRQQARGAAGSARSRARMRRLGFSPPAPCWGSPRWFELRRARAPLLGRVCARRPWPGISTRMAGSS